MADDFIWFDETATGDRKLDAEQLVVGANTVLRERMQIAGAAATAIAGCDATNGLDVDVTRVTGTVTVDSELPAAAALADAAANPTTPMAGAALLEFNGTTWDRARGDTTNGIDVDVTRVTGTVTVDSELTTADLDTGAGADTRAVVGLVRAESGGGVLVGSANPLPIDVIAALPAGTNAIGKLAANTGVDIGDVDVLSIVPGTGATNLGKAIDAVAGATDTGMAPLAIRDDALSALTPIEGDYVPLRAGSTGALWVDVASLPALPAGANNIGDVDIVSLPNEGQQTMANSISVAVASDQSAIATTPAGNVAHDAADSGNPVKTGAKATTSLAGLTLVANADRTDLFAGVDGALIVRPYCNLEDQLQEIKSETAGASTAMTVGLAAPGAGLRIWLTSLIIANSSATNLTVDIRDGAAGAVLATIPVPANGGCVTNLPVPLKFTANTAVAFDGSAAATTLYVTGIGFRSKI